MIRQLASTWVSFLAVGPCGMVLGAGPLEEHPLSAEKRAAMTESFEKEVARLTKGIEEEPKQVELYSRRGDASFFLAKFPEAVADYEKMVELNPDLENSHWRRGIAYFYAGRPKDAARQFEIYHSFDDVDRENGIWRYLSQTRAVGREKAREGLLKYKKDDREPFPAVYQLFAGKTEPATILDDIAKADVSKDEREKRLFYAELYIGLNHAVDKEPEEARKHLRAAVANRWGRVAGYGPTYMWHVGRLHYDLLRRDAEKKNSGQ